MENSKFKLEVYDDRYFRWHHNMTRNYATETMNWFIDTFKPESIIDFGCGIGAYLESGLNKGITNLKGYDIGGNYLLPYINDTIKEFIEFEDCTKILDSGKYDCVISLETGEHIDPSGSDNFIDNLCNSTEDKGFILFSAAPPGQGGTGHINCQPKSFWLNKFLTRGFVEDRKMTDLITKNWKSLKAPDYICSNLIVLGKNFS